METLFLVGVLADDEEEEDKDLGFLVEGGVVFILLGVTIFAGDEPISTTDIAYNLH